MQPRLQRHARFVPSIQVARSSPPSGVGLLLADLDFNALYANDEAISILSFAIDTTAADFVRWAQIRIRAILNTDRYTGPIDNAMFVSGRRQYVCRSFLLNAMTRPAVVGLLLQRHGHAIVDMAEISRRFRLSPRESETIRHLIHGLTTKEAAERMSVSPNTVKQFVRLIMSKMGVSTRSAIVGKLFSADLPPLHGDARRSDRSSPRD